MLRRSIRFPTKAMIVIVAAMPIIGSGFAGAITSSGAPHGVEAVQAVSIGSQKAGQRCGWMPGPDEAAMWGCIPS